MKINDLLKVAVNEALTLKPNEISLVKDLFKGCESNRISRSERLISGTLFLNYVKTEKLNKKSIGKTSSGQHKFIVIGSIDMAYEGVENHES